VTGGAAGLNLLLALPHPDVEADALAAASAAGIGLDGLAAGGYYEHDTEAGLIVGYAAAPEHAFQRAVDTLASVLRNVVA
jgi:GntR family transcriptional regulator / MocR family aminotransferase